MYLVKTPFWLRWLYPGRIWKMPAAENTIYLTFDDGPIPLVTPFVLEILKKFDAQATFFCIGDNIRKHPEIYRQLIAENHKIGNHTFHHLRGWDTGDNEYLDDIRKCGLLMNTTLFRPPHGRMRKSQEQRLLQEHPGTGVVMWDVLSGDFDPGLDPEKCLRNVLKHTRPGSIVVFHDSVKAFPRLQYVLPRAMEVWKARGYSFKTL
jgi:peptidoglycan-N-acetylglucosamine deacetylase